MCFCLRRLPRCRASRPSPRSCAPPRPRPSPSRAAAPPSEPGHNCFPWRPRRLCGPKCCFPGPRHQSSAWQTRLEGAASQTSHQHLSRAEAPLESGSPRRPPCLPRPQEALSVLPAPPATPAASRTPELCSWAHSLCSGVGLPNYPPLTNGGPPTTLFFRPAAGTV